MPKALDKPSTGSPPARTLVVVPRPHRGPGLLRRAAQKLLTQPWLLELAASRSAGYAAIFMLHRFCEAGASPTSFPIDTLRSHLEWLRKYRYRLVGLDTLVGDLDDGLPIPPRTVVFTVDDGYADFTELAVPIFAEFDCPVTVFVVTDFLDGKCWLWWDRIESAILQTRHASCKLEVGDVVTTIGWSNAEERLAAAHVATETMKYLPAVRRDAMIGRLLADLEVELPAYPTADYAPMTWERLRNVVGPLVRAGPHTMTHPILAMEDAISSEAEIIGSWQRLESELASALPVFCYPNGDDRAFGKREERLVAELGLSGSVSTTPGYASAAFCASEQTYPPAPLPRFSLEVEFPRFAQVVSGVDRFKRSLRPRKGSAATANGAP